MADNDGAPPARPGDDASGDGETGRIEELAEQRERIGRLEQGINELKDLIGGEGRAKGAHDAAQQHTESRLDRGSSVAEQVQQAVKDVRAEEEDQRRQSAHDAEHQALREARERPPREAQGGWRGKLQRAMFGGDR